MTAPVSSHTETEYGPNPASPTFTVIRNVDQHGQGVALTVMHGPNYSTLSRTFPADLHLDPVAAADNYERYLNMRALEGVSIHRLEADVLAIINAANALTPAQH